jgi:hypothetical protein
MNENYKPLTSLEEGWEDLRNGLIGIPPPLLSMMRTSYYSGAFAHSNLMYEAAQKTKANIAVGGAFLMQIRRELEAFREELKRRV